MRAACLAALSVLGRTMGAGVVLHACGVHAAADVGCGGDQQRAGQTGAMQRCACMRWRCLARRGVLARQDDPLETDGWWCSVSAGRDIVAGLAGLGSRLKRLPVYDQPQAIAIGTASHNRSMLGHTLPPCFADKRVDPQLYFRVVERWVCHARMGATCDVGCPHVRHQPSWASMCGLTAARGRIRVQN